ncbi:MAG TPA: DHHA1 domain-containing protein [Gemmatimonadaceae bacterium]|nr:DHHA1 domain-containing protein [Gemmatimonadaceae bacterium]
MTRRLYYTDSYLTDFSATVLSVDGRRVYLDSTSFYPTSGGQPHDVGVLGGEQVVDVVDEESRIAHVLAGAPAYSANAEVRGKVDWRRRFDHMQQHTGQHLLSALFEEMFGHPTVSVHFGDVSSTLDLDVETLGRDGVAEVERRANQTMLDNRTVQVGFEDAATAAGLRKPPEREGKIRVVTIDGLDRSACGGTHVRSTGEIGPVVIRRVEKQKKLSRVEFLCGWRALGRSRADLDALTRMAASMSASMDELPSLVETQAQKLRAADSELRKLGEAVAAYHAHDLYNAAVPDPSGLRRLIDRSSPMAELRILALAASRLPRALFIGTTASPPAVVLAASEDSGVNAGTVLRAALDKHGGRGGGSPRVAQGTVGDVASLEALVSELCTAV